VASALEGAPRTLDFLDDLSRRHHDEVRRLLEEAGIPFRDDPSLVRGLDYYTRTVFEVVSEDLGAQDAILGGGRYDGLVESLGGPSVPGIGFAIGEDRLLQVAPLTLPRRPCVVVLPQKPDDLPEANRIAREIRAALPAGCVEVDLGARGLKKGMARASALFEEADRRGFDRDGMLAVLVGERERAEGAVTVKRLATGEQETFPRAELARRLGAARER
jgi:histidyl-tRNA synthetase